MIRCSSNVRRHWRGALSAKGVTKRARAAWALTQAVGRRAAAGEAERLAELYVQARRELEAVPEKAAALATRPLGPLPEGTNALEAAAWTVVANVVLNLDETLTKP